MPNTGTADLTGRPTLPCSLSLQMRLPVRSVSQYRWAIKGSFRAPFAIVDTVENSITSAARCCNIPWRPKPCSALHDLRVSRAYGSYFIGEGEAAFKEIDVTVELQLARK